jgi:glycosyltransferase involved in cell wall biosynthesis
VRLERVQPSDPRSRERLEVQLGTLRGIRATAPEQPTFSVLVPTSNRRHNLALALRGLDLQRTAQTFDIVVVDDGSTDGTCELAEAQFGSTRTLIRWVGTGPVPRGVSCARNVGVRNRHPAAEVVVTLDADVVLEPEALDRLWHAARSYPNAVAFGVVHWLADKARGAVHDALDDGDLTSLRALVPAVPPTRVEGTIVGADPRPRSLFRPAEEARPVELNSAYGLNTFCAIPVAVLESVGGWDENIVGYGYEDIEFAARLASARVQAVYVANAVGFHVWHPKEWQRAALEAERNLDYVLRRLGPEAITDAYADWTVWWHYHRDRGGVVKRDSAALYAVNRRRDRAIALPDSSWLARLGFNGAEVAEMADGELASMEVHGQAHELPLTRVTQVDVSIPRGRLGNS